MVALVFLITFLPFLRIPSPIPGGYFNVGDAVIMLAAILLGKKSGLFIGAVGSALADLAAGSFIFVPITFVVKGLEGYLVGLIAQRGTNEKQPSTAAKLLSVTVGAIEIAAGYFVGELVFLRLIDKSLAVTAIVTELPGNLIQGVLSAFVAFILVSVVYKSSIAKMLD
jgi:uncharacterized membrane protein